MQVQNGKGLATIGFTVKPGTVGDFTVHINLDPNAGTLLSDNLGNGIQFTTRDGTLSITAVPEPSGAVPGAFLLVLLVGHLMASRRC